MHELGRWKGIRHNHATLGVEAMDRLVVVVGTDELLGLQALAGLDGASDDDAEKLQRIAGLAMRHGLAAKLQEAGLPWAPAPAFVDGGLLEPRRVAASSSAETVSQPETASDASTERSASPGDVAEMQRRSRPVSLWDNTRVRTATLAALATVTLVVLLGGYVGKWSWTGLASNDQVWDWLHLLLLPVAFGTLPLWLQFAEHMSRARKATLLLAILAFAGFVVAGYLVPISWTGFSGNTLWDWLTLVVLPVALITIRAWPSSPRDIRRIHIVVVGALGTAWLITLLGGYDATWQWTGYPGNTLWDWLQLLLGPLVIATVLVPAAVRWVSGDAARLAETAAREKAATTDHATAATPAAQQANAEEPDSPS
jgi:hypothetical protein